MKAFLFVASMLISFNLCAQTDSWKVTLNNKVLLIATEENPVKNQITVSKAALLKKGSLVISYLEKKPEKGWKREISVVDSGENELAKRDSKKITISNAQLKAIVNKGIKTISIYSWTLPTDPKKAAVVRVRRVHLCTITIR